MNAPTRADHPPVSLEISTTLGIIAAAADLSLVIDPDGNIRDVRVSNEQLPLDNISGWIGKSWASVVTSESRIKIEELIADAVAGQPSRWRHINYPSSQGADVPILCAAMKASEDGSIIAFGRDLRTMASLQQRLVEAHQAMERDYLRMRHMETRYRLLFELAAEAVLIIDTSSQRILEANPAASKILGMQTKKLLGKSLPECVSESYRSVIDDLLQGVRSSGEADARSINDANNNAEIMVSASLFRQESGTLFLVRLTPASLQEPSVSISPKRSVLLEVLERSPDAFVVTDNSGKILTCNHAFIEMAQLTKAEQVTGRNLSDWLGRSDVDLSVLIANIQQRGAVRLFATMLHGVNGADLQVEISGVSVKSSPTPCLGFSIRDVGQRLGTERPSLHQLPRSADQLVELVGRVPLQEIVSETADLIEKLCIEAALRLTRDNRASAAEMLGLSRQSLYVKLRRYGIGEVTDRSKK
jgi:transcriptional regulator PpsR